MNVYIEYDRWLKESEADLKSAENMLKTKEYVWALFVGHISIEKLLKAIWIKQQGKLPPKTHNLAFIANQLELNITKEDIKHLADITRFNILVRYPDNEEKFREICNKEFASHQISIIKGLYGKLRIMLEETDKNEGK